MTARRLLSGIETGCRVAVGCAFCVLIAAVAIQVLGRSVFNDSPVWTEELTRFALLFLTAFGVGLSYRNGDLVNVDLVAESLPGKLPWICRLVSAMATTLLCLLLIIPAWKYTAIGARQTSPALGWRMDFIHVSVLVLLIGLMVFALLRVIDMLTGTCDGLPVNNQKPLDPQQ